MGEPLYQRQAPLDVTIRIAGRPATASPDSNGDVTFVRGQRVINPVAAAMPLELSSPRRLRAVMMAALGGASLGCSGVDPRPATWEYISPVIAQPTCAT